MRSGATRKGRISSALDVKRSKTQLEMVTSDGFMQRGVRTRSQKVPDLEWVESGVGPSPTGSEKWIPFLAGQEKFFSR